MESTIAKIIANRVENDQLSAAELTVILRQLAKVLQAGVAGDVVEFGCYEGATSLALGRLLQSQETPRQLYLYDSFVGLPEKTPQDISPVGWQFQAGELCARRASVEQRFVRAGMPRPHIVKGWFADISPDKLPSAISFAFLDGDYYQSISDSLRLIWPRLCAGAVVVVDDYANEALPGVARAVDEWLQDHPVPQRVEQSLALLTIPGKNLPHSGRGHSRC